MEGRRPRPHHPLRRPRTEKGAASALQRRTLTWRGLVLATHPDSRRLPRPRRNGGLHPGVHSSLHPGAHGGPRPRRYSSRRSPKQRRMQTMVGTRLGDALRLASLPWPPVEILDLIWKGVRLSPEIVATGGSPSRPPRPCPSSSPFLLFFSISLSLKPQQAKEELSRRRQHPSDSREPPVVDPIRLPSARSTAAPPEPTPLQSPFLHRAAAAAPRWPSPFGICLRSGCVCFSSLN